MELFGECVIIDCHSFSNERYWFHDKDLELQEALQKLDSKMVIQPFESTAENLCIYYLDKICSLELPENISQVSVKIFETENTYAEETKKLT